ncbi:hypothetical protein SLEP1_g48171 [Rubroshorea leprosula]|uniref:Transmembrane protein n=1 Tax=Rubroshorea leprosula TaxID=152421 RepID=A0AAV5LSS9_9ROSI|nr:hypothetical protein SLEP1_g48171 [Rubroshorea leprosula]
MDHFDSRERELKVDIESGGTSSEEERTNDNVSANGQTKMTFSRVWSGLLSFDALGKGESGINSCSPSSSFGGVESKNMELLIDKSSGESPEHKALLEKNHGEEKQKKTNVRKPPKPPRPPKGPILDAADQKLVRDIAELAMRKRARMKRIQALKKMKAAKSSSTNSNLSAFIVTLLFCLVIIFQGLCSRSSGGTSDGSPAPAVASSEALVSIQFYKKFSNE